MFKPNNTYSKGRPKNALNKTSNAIRTAFQKLLENNIEGIQKDLDSLEAKDRLKFMIDLSSFVLPKLRSIEANINTDNVSFRPIEIVFKDEGQSFNK